MSSGVRVLGSVSSASWRRFATRLGELPEVGAPLGRKDRKRRVPRFPYDVVYRIKEERILVLAIKHHRRRPGYWTWRRYR
jgi:toxin ParE1/3/4